MKLVDVAEEHIELIFKWRNKSFIRAVMYNSEPIVWENHVAWFQSVLESDTKYLKILYYNQIPYGVANFALKDLESNVGEWGFYIGEQNAPKGMGTALAYKMLGFLFEEANVRKVCAEVIDFNERSIHFHGKVGFQQDGVLRKHIFKNNHYCDIYLFSYFQDEWREKKQQLEKLFD